MKKGKRHILLLLSILLSLAVRGQSGGGQEADLAERLHSLAQNAPPELAYIQTSKDIYETGEDLWFKVYLLDARDLMPSFLSKTLYLQLFNEYTRKVVWEEKYEILHGISSGKAYLGSTLPEGDYFLAAYTPNSFFDDTTEFKALKRIKIVTDITAKTSVQAATGKPALKIPFTADPGSIQFSTFPEGGELISGLQSKLAFKAVNRNGEPVDVEGMLFEDNVPLIEFKSRHAGMGSFDFTPDSGRNYYIRLTKPSTDSTYLLPEIAPAGMTLKLAERSKETITFSISQSPARKENDFFIRIQCRGVVYGMTSGKVSKEAIVKIPLFLLPQGIAEVTLFNSNLVPVAERLVYVNQEHKLNITAVLSKEVYPVRGKASLKITVKDEYGNPVMADLGVSIFDKLYQNPRDSGNIMSHIYLSTQLKGRIYNPSYYFNSNSKGREEALDLLMLTQGWRKYIWDEKNLKEFKEHQQQIVFDEIRGEIYNTPRWKKMPKDQLMVMAYSPNKDSVKVFVSADSTGAFTVPSDRLKAWENDYVYLKPVGPPESNPKITLSDPFKIINQFMKYNEVSYPISRLSVEKKDTADLLSGRSDLTRIKEVTIKGQKANTLRSKYIGSLESLLSYSFTSDYVCRFNILNCRNHPIESDNKKPVEGERYLVETNDTYVLTVYHSSGNNVLTEDQLLKIFNLTRVKAYFGSREFYQPNYDKEAEEGIPDFRNTLLWEPSVITNEKGEATLSFFCSDINTDFVGRIEGIGGEGLLGAGYFKFSVRKVNFSQ